MNCQKQGICIVIIVFMFLFTACGLKDESEVVSDLSDRLKKMESYQGHGKLVIQTGSEPVTYDVEVWYKKPHFYRVSLKNEKKDITQILLRNNQGVFVLTPHLKKSFRFQSDWPEQGGQIYLYQTIMDSIVDDQERKMETHEKEYQFDVAMNDSIHANLSKQRIWLDDKLHPKKIHVLNTDNKVVAKMNFDRFETNTSFDADAFNTERNFSYISSDTKQAIAKQKPKEEIDVVAPGYVPQGNKLSDEQVIQTTDGPVSILRFSGEQPFTLTVRHPVSIEASLPVSGKPILLDQTVGLLLEMDQQKKISWIHNQREYQLIGKMETEEMLKVANSIFDQPEK